MPDSADHRVEMHRIAQRRRDSGQPVWAHRWPIKDLLTADDSDAAAIAFAAKCAARIKSHAKSMLDPGSSEFDEGLDEIVWRLADIGKAEGDGERGMHAEANDALEELYDWADYKRVWLG